MLALALGVAGCVRSTVPVTGVPQQASPAVPAPAVPGPVETPPPAASVPQAEPTVVVGGRTNISLLLPLTGANASLGRAMLDAATLALFELGDNTIALTPRDTQSTADGAGHAAAVAVAEGARLIVGPLTGSEVEAVKPVAQAAGINVLAFSNLTRVAGDGVFLMGFQPRQEMTRIATYARSTGIEHFAALIPTGDYGDLAIDAFRGAIEGAGGTLDQVETYDPGAGAPASLIQRLAAGGKASFQALLVPEGGSQLKAIAPLLPFYNLDTTKIRVLGSGQWDDPGLALGREPALVGAWYAAPPADARAGFEKSYADAYGRKPPRLASLAYDAMGVAVVLARIPGTPDFSATALTNPSGFAGADGIFRLLPDGTAERGLAVLEITRTGTNVVSPAPDSFAGPVQ
ncbi:MAG TPA: penicillin-binding protein activator [Stellaceae bacterium]|nr:penicillin-binding protein activator [Stellaceae bacterium]